MLCFQFIQKSEGVEAFIRMKQLSEGLQKSALEIDMPIQISTFHTSPLKKIGKSKAGNVFANDIRVVRGGVNSEMSPLVDATDAIGSLN